MGYKTEFDLNKELEIWRETLLDSNTMDKENVLELENHLLDEMEDLTEYGLNDDEAYWVAQKRLGQPSLLVREYQKVEQMPLENWLRTVVGGAALAYGFVSVVYSLSLFLSVLGHVYITSCSSGVFLGMIGVLGLSILGISNLVSLEKMKSFLEGLLIKYTLVIVVGAFLLRLSENVIAHLLTRLFFSRELFSAVMISSMLMTILVVVITLIGFVVNVKTQKTNATIEYI